MADWSTWLFKMRFSDRRGRSEFTVALSDSQGVTLQTSAATPSDALRALMSMAECPREVVHTALGWGPPTGAVDPCPVRPPARKLRRHFAKGAPR